MARRRVPRQARARRKQEALLEAGLAEFSEREYPEVTARSVAARAGVSVGTFYEYFASKDILLRDVQKAQLQAFVERIVDDAGQLRVEVGRGLLVAVRSALQLTYDFHVAGPRLHDTVEYRRRFDPELHAMMVRIDAMILERIAAVLERLGAPEPAATAFAVISMAEGVVHRVAFGTFTATEAEALLDDAAALLTGCLTQRGCESERA